MGGRWQPRLGLRSSITLLQKGTVLSKSTYLHHDQSKLSSQSEDNRNPYLAATPYHGTGGYLTVQESPWRTPLATAFVEAGVEMGYENRDGNGEFQTGFMIPQGTIRRGSRY